MHTLHKHHLQSNLHPIVSTSDPSIVERMKALVTLIPLMEVADKEKHVTVAKLQVINLKLCFVVQLCLL
ncbi:hypothetical protein P8452_27954 [Trifolium repens]|nr:hypothetical protein P8452_27954 [Trifolium repens]